MAQHRQTRRSHAKPRESPVLPGQAAQEEPEAAAEGEGSPPRHRPWARQGRRISRPLSARIHPIPVHPPQIILHAGAWCKANPGPIAIAGSEAVLPWRRVGQLLLDIVLGLRTVSQTGVVGNGGRPVDQIVHTAEVVEGVDVPLLDAISYRVHSLFEARDRIEPGLSPHGLHYSAVLGEQRHLELESLPGHIVGKYRG